MVRSPVAEARTVGVCPTLMRVIWLLPLKSLMRRPTSALAASKRVGSTSVACMEAEPSSKTTTLPLTTLGTGRNGRAKANTSAAKISNCKIRSKLRRSFCQGALASRSRSSFCHSMVLLTNTSRRRSRSMYSRMMGPASRPSRRKRGVRNDTVFQHPINCSSGARIPEK